MNRNFVAALYKFASLPDYRSLKEPLYAVCIENQVMGTLLLAREGINGTIAGPEKGVRAVLAYLRNDERFADLEHKESWADEIPFLRMKVRLKREIVTMGIEGVDPNQSVGTYVSPQDWNALISDPEVVVIDTRNAYEVDIGTFKGALSPETTAFREFPDWVKRSSVLKNKPKVAMFCTGGIRCEKASSYLRNQGFEDVFHLQGGILKYLETVPEDQSLWDGQCFVFDQRVSVGHGLEQGHYDLCHACRNPIDADDKASALYVKGVSCPNCHDTMSAAQKQRYSERQRQIELAKSRNQVHLGTRQLK